jgi:uncharacterized protein YdhG (YjbR/CyaY superfamily)
MKATDAGEQLVDEYIAGFPADVQQTLQQVRQTIRAMAPGATEAIKYGIPTLVLNKKNLIHFAGYKKHIGVYPVPRGDPAFTEAIAPYQTGKGTAQFQLDKPIPHDLIRKMVEFRLKGPDIGGAWG